MKKQTIKKTIISCLILLAITLGINAQEAVLVKQPQIPILIDRQDNVLYYIRINAAEGETLDKVTLKLEDETNLENIKSIKLYYSGTESVQRAGKTFYAPAQYIARNTPKYTRSANPSYSIKKSEINKLSKSITLDANQKLFPDINYFWVSIEMKPQTPLHSKVKASITSIVVNGKDASVTCDGENMVRRMGIGVRYAGDDDVAAYRIPGMATSNSGTLLAVYDVRRNDSNDLQEFVDVGVSRSTDGGQSWEDMRIAMSFGEYGGLPLAQNGVGDPAILVDKNTGTIWVIAAWTHGMGNRRAWVSSQPGMDIYHTAQLVLVKSDDDGKTWSEPINITSQVKDPSWHFLLQGPGNGITMQDGTLVFASQYIGADRIPNAGIIYSKDHGKTWHIHEHARTNTTEAQVAEIEPGLLMLNMRDNRGGSRAVYTTTDLGKTWKEHPSSRTALIEPVCMASLINVKAEDNVLKKDILLFSNPNSTNARNNMTIKASLDGGLTWKESDQILLDEDHGWGYSCLSMIDDETVGILYESSTAQMLFQAVKLTDLIK